MSSEENKSNSEKIINPDSPNSTLNCKEMNLKEESLIKEQQNKKSSISSKPIKKQKSNPNSTVNENTKFNFFQSKRINPFEKKDIFDKPCCSCTKTKCIKKYCECFANNRYCKDCHCIDCKNKYIYLNNSYNLKDSSENEKIFCTCTKSNCNKKYCECYKSRKKCNEECRCVNCLNNTSPTFTIHSRSSSNIDNNNNNNINLNENNNLNNLNNNNKINMNLDEEKSNDRKSLSSNDSSDTYKIQRVSIFIDQYQTLVNVEKFTKEDMMLISKKRYSTK